ncbi:MAG: Ycf66 family protein [Spirulinaceae cyanobacterium]
MLAYILAVAVSLGSLALYMAAFFFPKLHRKSDFYWSIPGLFYALILWVCAGQITGAVLLGQLAVVALLGWFTWQTVSLRYVLEAPEERTEADQDLLEKIKGFLPTKFFTSLASRPPKATPEVEVKDTSSATTEVELELPPEVLEATTEIASEVPEVPEVEAEMPPETPEVEATAETALEVPEVPEVEAEIPSETPDAEIVIENPVVDGIEISNDLPEETEETANETESNLKPKPERKKVADTSESPVTFEERVIQQRPTDKS